MQTANSLLALSSHYFCCQKALGNFDVGIELLKTPRKGCVDGQKLDIAKHQDNEPQLMIKFHCLGASSNCGGFQGEGNYKSQILSFLVMPIPQESSGILHNMIR